MMSSKINSSNSQTLKYPKTVELLSYTFIIFPFIGAGGVENGPVSYTHLTLPTILLV